MSRFDRYPSSGHRTGVGAGSRVVGRAFVAGWPLAVGRAFVVGLAFGAGLTLDTGFALAADASRGAAAAPAANRSASIAGIGREATPAEIAAWDIDVRPDFRGLPPGRGTVARGQEIWDEKCASCHGTFGESNEVFAPIVGGTTAQDQQVGLASGLLAEGGRTTLMKLATVSTLWDYINRAMPWNAPRSLPADDVYASVAYILNLGGIVGDDFELSHENIAAVQEKLPNREGMTRRHGLWTVDGTPDVRATACMTDCRPAMPTIRSRLPDYARNAHGNLSEQHRILGPTRGATTLPRATAPASFEETRRLAHAVGRPAGADAGSGVGSGAAGGVAARVAGAGCNQCHAAERMRIGPGWRQISERHRDKPGAIAYLAGKIAAGSQGVWGSIPMPAQPAVSEPDRQAIAAWLVDGAR